MIPLSGRSDIVRRIRTRLLDASADQGSILLVTGGLGLGKTATAHEAASAAEDHGFRVLRAAGAEQEQDFAFGVLDQLLDQMLDQTADEPIRRNDGDPVGASAHGLWRAVSAICRTKPVLIVVDDLHWVDDDSLRQLAFLANRLSVLPAVLLVTMSDGASGADRPEVRDVTETARELVRLPLLDRDAVRELVRHRLGEEPDDEFAAVCSAASGGIPLVLNAVLAELAAEGVRPVAANAGAVATSRPWHLHAVFLARLRAQPDRSRAVAAAIGMLDVAVDIDLIARVAGLSVIDATVAVDALVRQGMLLPHPLRFPHPGTREAAVDLVAPEEREARHLAAAAALYRRGHDNRVVARHLMAVTAPLPEWGAEVLRGACREAERLGDPQTATRYLRRVLQDVPADSAARGAVLADLASVERSTDIGASVRHTLEAVVLLPDVRARASVLSRLPPLAFGAHPVQLGAALEPVEADLGRAPTEPVDDPLVKRLSARRLVLDGMSRTDLLRPTGRHAQLRTAAGRELLAVAAFHAALRGDRTAAEVAAVGEELVGPVAPEVGETHSALPFAAGALVLAGRGSAARSWLRTADAAPGVDPVWAATVGVAAAVVDLGAGASGRARAGVEPGIVALGASWFDAVSTTGLLLAAAAVRADDLNLAEQVVRQCGTRTDHPALGALRQFLTGARAAERGDLDEALSRVLDAGWRLDRLGWRNPAVLPWRSAAAVIRGRLGDPAAAIELAQQEGELARRWGAPAPRARALLTLSGLLPDGQGAAVAAEALGVLSGAEDEGERARASLTLAKLLRLSEPREAAHHLRVGRALVRKLGMTGGERQATGGNPTPGELTRAERRVAGLAADGRSNRSIAEGEGVSVRAVEKHLTSVYRKLGLSGRRQLRTAWRRQDS